MGSEQEVRTQTCECGNDTYHIKFELDLNPSVWAECAECGRPSRTETTDGQAKQMQWFAENKDG